jgi:LysM repeat protein
MHSRLTTTVAIGTVGLLLVITGSALVTSAVAAAERTVVVRPGDTLGAIALRYGTTVSELAAANHLANPNLIYAGQRLRIGGSSPSPSTAGTAATAPTTAPQTHIVVAGDTLIGIASRYGTTVSALVTANHLANPNLIYAGERLTVPAVGAGGTRTTSPGRAGSSAPQSARTHLVVAGDSLTGIAAHYGTTVDAIIAVNPRPDPNLIYIGERLTIPTSGAPGSGLPRTLAAQMTAHSGVRSIVAAEAARQGVPVAFALAVAWQESGWRQDLTSVAGAVGVMQLLPTTADWVAQTMLGGPVNVYDTRQNVTAGVRLLEHYLARYHGDRRLALAAYYQGQRSADSQGVLQVSEPYIASVLALEAMLR